MRVWMRRAIFFGLLASFTAWNCVCVAWAQEPTPSVLGSSSPSQESNDEAESGDQRLSPARLSEMQQRLAENYRLLEQKLFDLHEFESDRNPDRSELLRRAFEQSQEKLTGRNLEAIVELLGSNRLRPAEDNQTIALEDLRALLTLLESEDRSQRLREREQQIKEYIEEVDRLLNIQRGLRSQAENGVDESRLQNSEERLAERTEQLTDRVQRESPEGESQQGESQQGESQQGESQQGESQQGESQQGESQQGESQQGESQQGESQQGESQQGESQQGESQQGESQQGESQQGESQQGESQQGESQQGESQQGESQQGESQQGESQQGESQQGESQQGESQPQDPVQQRLKAAEEKMREAERKLEEAKRDESIEAMRQAEQELAQARKELEEILRQLREEEIGRTLAQLEGRFRKMLEEEIRIYESTKRLDRTIPEQRTGEYLIQAGKLAIQQRDVAVEADRALTLLLDEGSSVAFPEVVEQVRDDMLQISSRLNAGNPGSTTQQLEEDVIDSLDYVIEALVKAQQDLEQQQQQGQGQMPPGEAGEQPLVDQLAELRMLRGLQERIYRRHERYSRLLDDPDDPIGATDDPEMVEALEKLGERQRQLHQITRDLLLGREQ